ncbi:MAG TPA: lysylphosphatidylglycerol synthase transmembrane domain-containing protein, partial [Acidimicrobiales bacterium]|nr:lysylphosphatidylglycerol synthase transmembrane domain-containing protein [Acidimicrobiales bacterium]
GGGGHGDLVWFIVLIVVGIAVALGVVLIVPRLRRVAKDKLRPKLSEVWAHLRILAKHPRNMVEIFGGSILAQLLIAFALGTALHAFGQHLGLAQLLVVLTLASMVGGVSPVPGGMGVVEAGMILCLVAAGVPQTDAVAATFVQRLFTSYLPPIWGWFVLVWMRKKEYL